MRRKLHVCPPSPPTRSLKGWATTRSPSTQPGGSPKAKETLAGHRRPERSCSAPVSCVTPSFRIFNKPFSPFCGFPRRLVMIAATQAHVHTEALSRIGFIPVHSEYEYLHRAATCWPDCKTALCSTMITNRETRPEHQVQNPGSSTPRIRQQHFQRFRK